MVKLRLEKLTNVPGQPKNKPIWWIIGLPYEECQTTRCGPYRDRKEAASDMHGMQLVFDDINYTGRRRGL